MHDETSESAMHTSVTSQELIIRFFNKFPPVFWLQEKFRFNFNANFVDSMK